MKYSEIDNKSEDELRDLLAASRVQLAKLRFDAASKALKDNSQISKTRKDIARILTAVTKIHYTSKS